MLITSIIHHFSQLYYWREASLIKGLKVNKTKLHKGFYTTAEEPSGILTELYPYSKYKMYMVVANKEYEGPQSNTVEFQTKEGGMSHYTWLVECFSYNERKVHCLYLKHNMNSFLDRFIEPGAPKYFKIQKHTDVVQLKWDKPLEPNGVLMGYTLQYQTGENTLYNCKQQTLKLYLHVSNA